MIHNTITTNVHTIIYISNDMYNLVCLVIAITGHMCMKANIHICILVLYDVSYTIHTIQYIIYVTIVTICYIYFEVDK